jgi:hypothetical protein
MKLLGRFKEVVLVQQLLVLWVSSLVEGEAVSEEGVPMVRLARLWAAPQTNY